MYVLYVIGLWCRRRGRWLRVYRWCGFRFRTVTFVLIGAVDTLSNAIASTRFTHARAVLAFVRVIRTSNEHAPDNTYTYISAFWYWFDLLDVFAQQHGFVRPVAAVAASVACERVVNALARLTTVLVQSLEKQAPPQRKSRFNINKWSIWTVVCIGYRFTTQRVYSKYTIIRVRIFMHSRIFFKNVRPHESKKCDDL